MYLQNKIKRIEHIEKNLEVIEKTWKCWLGIDMKGNSTFV